MLGINGLEFVVLLVVAAVVIGPERLPRYAEQLGRGVRSLRRLLGSAKERVATELGDQAPDVDWASLDPRRYDPRRIVREALLDEPMSPGGPRPVGAGAAGATGAHGAASGSSGGRRWDDGAGPGAVPFDDEAT